MSYSDLPEEMILNLCENMDTVELSKFIQSSKRNRDICSEVLKRRELKYYLDKFSSNDPILIQVITLLVNFQKYDNSRYYRILRMPRNHYYIHDSPSNQVEYNFFAGNKSRAILKAADYIYENIGNINLNNPVNLFKTYKFIFTDLLNKYSKEEMDEFLSKDLTESDLYDENPLSDILFALYPKEGDKYTFFFMEYTEIPKIKIF